MDNSNLPDIQKSKPKIPIPIHQVGVENVVVPFRLESKYGGYHQTIANVSMRTNLEENLKGISMSRLIRTLTDYLELPLKHKLLKDILKQLQASVGGTASYIKFDFCLPMNRESPVSHGVFPIYYNCKFEGQLYDDIGNTNTFRFFQGVVVQYASYCPCSAALCDHLASESINGYPHSQRSFADVLVETQEPHYVWLEDIIEAVERDIKTLPYPIIKREDEQEIARIAARNPMFVEDAIRCVSNALNCREDIFDWIVKCTHEESIHTSEAIAVNWKGIPNGFNGRRFI